jgi:two-component system response regulator
MNKKILLVEDNRDDEELIMLAFKKSEISQLVHIVRDGAEALEYLFGSINGNELRNPSLKLVLLDLKLPRIDGLEVLKRIKKHPKAKNISVVVFTSSQEEKDMVESYRLNVDGYISKPMDYKDFPKAIERLALCSLISMDKKASIK